MFTSTPVKKACDNLYACYSFKKLSLSRGAQIPGARLPWRISRLRNITGNGCRAGVHKYREPSRSSVSNLFHVTLLAPRILIWLIDFCKNREPLLKTPRSVFVMWQLLSFLTSTHRPARVTNSVVTKVTCRVMRLTNYIDQLPSLRMLGAIPPLSIPLPGMVIIKNR